MIVRKKRNWGSALLACAAVAVSCVVLSMNVRCGCCDGKGKLADRETSTVCTHCHGKGTVCLNFKTMTCNNNTRICPQCNGAGRFSTSTTCACPVCDGKGKLPRYRVIARRFFSDGTP
jgi:DnaJ-class molecular chaperone